MEHSARRMRSLKTVHERRRTYRSKRYLSPYGHKVKLQSSCNERIYTPELLSGSISDERCGKGN